MSQTSTEIFEKIRQQFDFEPYPRTSIESSPKDNSNLLFIHNLVTPYYLRYRKVINPENTVILDAGCGSGVKCLALALANPGAKVVGIDLSKKSIELAKQRLHHHGIKNAEFHALGIQDLPQLGLAFDYINCDEVLYLFPNIADGLRSLKAVLKPEGIIRSNLHSAFQRVNYFRAQKLFSFMGLMDGNPEDLEIEAAIETLKALKPTVDLKKLWSPKFESEERNEAVLMNLLFQGDKGFAIPELFQAFRQADLEFISMTDWQTWDLMSLFENPDELPPHLAMGLPECSTEEKLYLFDLLQPKHRLLDFWCGHSVQIQPSLEIDDWEITDWKNAQVHLHPQLKTSIVRECLMECLEQQAPFMITRHLSASIPEGIDFFVDATIAGALLPLWESSQPFTALLERYLQLKPRNLVTLEPTRIEDAIEQLQRVLRQLESYLYVLLEPAEQDG